MSQTLKDMYRDHHQSGSRNGFTILEKERSKIFRDMVGVRKEVLDIGCRDGALTRHFVDGNTVLGVDIDEDLLRMARETLGIETTVFDLNGEWEELGGRKFDVVVAGEVVEHLFYPDRVATRIASHLIEGGMLVGSVPNAFTLKHRLRYLFAKKKHTPLSDPTHINHFSVQELEGMLKKHFQEVSIIGLGRYTRLSKLMPSLFAFDLVFICRI